MTEIPEIRSIILPIGLIVAELVSAYDLDFVTEIVRPESPEQVSSWISGTTAPSAEQAQRLRDAHTVLTQMATQVAPVTNGERRVDDVSDTLGDSVQFESAIINNSTGVFLVTTGGAVYVLDCVGRTVQRFHRTGTDYATAALRNDGEPAALLRLIDCRVGGDLILVIDLHLNPPRPTLRRSTEVISIVRFPDIVTGTDR